MNGSLKVDSMHKHPLFKGKDSRCVLASSVAHASEADKFGP